MAVKGVLLGHSGHVAVHFEPVDADQHRGGGDVHDHVQGSGALGDDLNGLPDRAAVLAEPGGQVAGAARREPAARLGGVDVQARVGRYSLDK